MGITIDGISYPNASVNIVTNGATPGPAPAPGPAPGPAPAPSPVPNPSGGNIVRVVYPWASPYRMPITFDVNDIVIVEVPTGNGSSVTGNLPFIRAAEAAGSFAAMDGALSENPGDFTPISLGSGGTSVSFRVDNPVEPEQSPLPGYYANLQRNRTYYFNLRNSPGNGVTGPRNIFIDLGKNGTP